MMREEQALLDLPAIVAQRFSRSIEMPERFFQQEEERIARACWAMSRRFYHGGRLWAFGNGAWASDAKHIAVEFVHPVIIGKRALPAQALTGAGASLPGSEKRHTLATQLRALARPSDIAIGFSPDGDCRDVREALSLAKQMDLLTLGLCGGTGGAWKDIGLDYLFIVDSSDPLVIQETHETLYHILWELVHVFFEHEGLLV
jgi:D-sedoheptulose 7-phosphate isomerase